MNIKKKWIVGVLLAFVIMNLSACGGSSKWLGTYGGTSTSGSKIEITINKNGSVIYKKDGKESEGEWTENENSINLDFDGEVSSASEPLIVTLSSDEQSITVESMNSGWNPDHYQRR
ncbi:hypothetical protein [Siminovitchia fortis]|uniref:Lipoprotein n=1 Tax=Siminovitchia fortis TaxID=254758 RepID=A0A443ILU2_9BACI|nr:hypothetical protein [Siminovitchia fortis]RWR06506.1 hypothetical protein D4N35_013990 [Siminovitchia fortis]WHY80867.1 hypothetical protein QNH23_13200 [Siminovitchia fortis]